MLIQPTIEKLCVMRLRGMAEAFEQQQQDANIHSLSFEERLGLLIDRQWNWRQNRALDRRLRNGRLQGPACIEDIDYPTPRGLDRQLVRSLTAESAWVREHQHLFLIGPTGVGKTWLARAFAHKACRDGYTALFLKAAEMFRDLATARADGSHAKLPDRPNLYVSSAKPTCRWWRWISDRRAQGRSRRRRIGRTRTKDAFSGCRRIGVVSQRIGYGHTLPFVPLGNRLRRME